MPIGSGEAYEVYRNRYEEIIEPAVEGLQIDGSQVFRCIRADFVSSSGSITRDVLTRLYRSDAVIADLTDLNPNVFYELGVRHSLRSGTILIALKGTKPPFDVGDLRVIPYEDRVGGQKAAIPEIQSVLRSLIESDKSVDSPVLLAIPQLSELGAVKEYEAQILSLEREREVLKAQLSVSEKTTLANQTTLEAMREAIEKLASGLTEPQRKQAESDFESKVWKRVSKTPMIPPPKLRDVEADPKTLFVLMPFAEELEPISEVIRSAAAKVGMKSYRADAIPAGGSIIDQIFESIARAGLIVADLTGRNQNVMYELGLAQAMGKETLLLAQDIGEVPFDVRHQRVFVYDLSFAKVKELEAQLTRAFEEYQRKSGA